VSKGLVPRHFHYRSGLLDCYRHNLEKVVVRHFCEKIEALETWTWSGKVAMLLREHNYDRQGMYWLYGAIAKEFSSGQWQ